MDWVGAVHAKFPHHENVEEEIPRMSNARNKLNAAAIRGVVLVAGLLALLIGSWPIFWLLVAVLLVTSIMDGDIRVRGRKT